MALGFVTVSALTTVSDLASPFSTVLSKNIDAHFDVDFELLPANDAHARSQVSLNCAVAYALKPFSIVFLALLSRQKSETQELRRAGRKSKWLGNLSIAYLASTLCWSLIAILMSFSSATSCLVIAGGRRRLWLTGAGEKRRLSPVLVEKGHLGCLASTQVVPPAPLTPMGVQFQPKHLNGSSNSPLDGTAATTPHLGYTNMSSSVALNNGSSAATNKTSQIGYSDRRQVFEKNPHAQALSGAVSHLPLAIQVAFRRKVLAIFALQLFFVAAVVAAFEWIPSLKSAWKSAIDGQEYYLVIAVVAVLAFLLALYLARTKFPWNWVCLFFFSVALSLMYAGLGAIFDTGVGVINCAALVVWVLVVIALSGVQVGGKAQDGDGEHARLLSTYVSGGVGFVVVAVGISVLYAIFQDDFVTQLGLVCTLALQLVMAIWFSHDAKGMFPSADPRRVHAGRDLLLRGPAAAAAGRSRRFHWGGGGTHGVIYVDSDAMALAQANDVATDDQA
ncbi:hypothetical protein Gpo141_00012736 [Globisporangium polare]